MLPILLLAYFNIHIMIEYRKIKRKRSRMLGQNRRSTSGGSQAAMNPSASVRNARDNNRLMLLLSVIVVMFFVCNIPLGHQHRVHFEESRFESELSDLPRRRQLPGDLQPCDELLRLLPVQSRLSAGISQGEWDVFDNFFVTITTNDGRVNSAVLYVCPIESVNTLVTFVMQFLQALRCFRRRRAVGFDRAEGPIN